MTTISTIRNPLLRMAKRASIAPGKAWLHPRWPPSCWH